MQEIRLTVGADARLEWLPEVTISFAGSRFRQLIHVDLTPGATVVLWDAMVSGRVVRDERWAFASYENEIVIRTASGQSAVGDARFRRRHGEKLELCRVALCGRRFGRAGALSALEAGLVELCEQQPGELLGGVSMQAVPGLIVKVVARSAPALAGFLEAAWRQSGGLFWHYRSRH